MTIIELTVNMDCPGCENKIKKALQKLDGVDNVDIDMGLQKVTVTGYVDQEEVLKTVTKNGRKAELWPVPFNPVYHNFDEYYCDQYGLNASTNYYQYQLEQYQHNMEQNPNPPTNYYQYQLAETNPHTNYYVAEPVSSNVHGYYNGHDHSYYRQPPYSVFNQPTSVMFSDENAHACSIM